MTGLVAINRPCSTWRSLIPLGLKSQFARSMKLPLSETEKLEIQAAYETALSVAQSCAEQFENLSLLLNKNFACIGDDSKKALDQETLKICAAQWKMKLSKHKLLTANLEDREFSPEAKSLPSGPSTRE